MDDVTFARATNCSPTVAREWAPAFAAAFAEFGITDRLDRAMILALAACESGQFRVLEETFNYSSGALRRKFGTKFSPYQASMLGFQMLERVIPPERQKAIANLAYGGFNGNGAREGWQYRGRGPLMLRGKKYYAQVSGLVGVDLVADPDAVLVPAMGARVVCAMFTAEKCHGVELGEVEKRLRLEPCEAKTNPRGLAYRRARSELPQ